MNNSKMVEVYINQMVEDLKSSVGIKLPDSVINSLKIKYLDSDLSYADIIQDINIEVEDFLDKMVEKDEDYSLETEKRLEEEKALEEMSDKEEKNVRINDSDINLMMIASASTPEELQNVINKIPNLNTNLKSGNLDNVEFNYLKNMIFEQYKESIPDGLRDIGNLGLVTMEEYKGLAEDINNDYDSITIDNGNGEVTDYNIDKDFDIEEHKNDSDIVNKEDINIKDDKGYVEEHDNVNYNKETFDFNKKRQNDLNDMFKEEIKVENTPLEKRPAKVLKIEKPESSNSEKGYTDTINIMLSIISFSTVILLLLLYFIIS